MDKYKACIDQIAALGADTVELVVGTRQENGNSTQIYLDMRMTPTADQLGDLIHHAKSKQLRVMLMPIVLLDDPNGNEWRGTIEPGRWDEWFDSYRDMIDHFAYVAQRHHADVLVSGRNWSAPKTSSTQWTQTINSIRDSLQRQAHVLLQLGSLQVGPVLGSARSDRHEQLLEARRGP